MCHHVLNFFFWILFLFVACLICICAYMVVCCVLLEFMFTQRYKIDIGNLWSFIECGSHNWTQILLSRIPSLLSKYWKCEWVYPAFKRVLGMQLSPHACSTRDLAIELIHWAPIYLVCLFTQTGFLCILELTMLTSLSLNSQIRLPLLGSKA